MTRIVVEVSAEAEWAAVREYYAGIQAGRCPFGEYLEQTIEIAGQNEPVVCLHGGWGKIAAAAATQYAMGRWAPELLVNLGTCGGIAGAIQRGAILLVERTLVYDIIEQIGDFDQAIAHYTTALDLSWLRPPYPQAVQRGLLVSGDRDLLAKDVGWLKERFGALAGDWESGAIAWVAARNGVRCLILRGVTDLVSEEGGEAYGDAEMYASSAREVMRGLLAALPDWLAAAL
jgi:adenosylhomocysteine nucleosidase